MFGKTVAVLMVLGAVAARDLSNVDPNTLSCDPTGREHLLLPHFSECNKFYMCTHGREVEFTCPSTTIFDFVLQTCNHPHATRCWLRDLEEEEEIEGSGGGSGGGGDSGEGGISGEGSGEGSGDFEFEWAVSGPNTPRLNCAEAASAARQLPFKGDCQRFWRCLGGLPQSAYCTEGLFFNSKTEQCDFEANVMCDISNDDELHGEFIVYN